MPEHQQLQLAPKQRELIAWFGRNAPSLREAYEAAIRLLSIPGFPVKAPLVAHLVREIANRLPDVLEETTSKRVQYKNELDDIAPLWQKHFHPKPDYSNTSTPSAHVSNPLPSKLFNKIEKLVSLHSESRSRLQPEERLFRSEVLGEVETPDPLRPMERQLKRVCDWFRGKAHLGNTVGGEVSQCELVRQFELFEHVLFALKGQFFKAIGELDEILQDAND